MRKGRQADASAGDERLLRCGGHLYDHSGDGLPVPEHLAGCGQILQSRQPLPAADWRLLRSSGHVYDHGGDGLFFPGHLAGCGHILQS